MLLATVGCGDGDGAPGSGGTTTSRPEAGAGGAAAPSERLRRWERERPDEPIRASLSFGGVATDSAVAAILARHSVKPYRAFVRVAGLTTSHRIPPEDASLRFLDVLGNQVRTGLEMSICAQPGRAASMLERDRDSLERAREVLERVERSVDAIDRLADAETPYVYGVEVEGTVSDIRSLMGDPDVAAVEPAVLVGGEVVVPEPRQPSDSGGASATGVGTLPADSVAARLRRLSEGLEGCGPAAGPPPRG